MPYHGRDGRYHLSRSAHTTASSCPKLCPLHPKVEVPVVAASTTTSPHCHKYSCFFYFFFLLLTLFFVVVQQSLGCSLITACLVHLISNIVFLSGNQWFQHLNHINCSQFCFYNRCLLGHFFIIFKRKANPKPVFSKASWRI